MKKKLEAELISIAHRILQLKDTTTLSQLQEESRQLYEKLTILTFAEAHFAGPQPTIGQITSALEQETSDELKEVQQKIKAIMEPKPTRAVQKEQKVEKPITPDHETTEKTQQKAGIPDKPELVIEEINARVSEDLFVPAQVSSKKNTSFSAPDYESAASIDDKDKPKSINDQLRKDIQIGLNDRLAFIKYLFNGNTLDYNRVLSQLETMRTKKEARDFISTVVKPDYNWSNKEEHEERFFDVILTKFEH
ncbi:hypothetical protein J8281_03295 [Aquimarina sp. U1-2]|uniref:hypothetical protein n=1 Tax=Aquimarina sp. U1-2 TaxID=2823141 RepID=UPI001AEC841B|nr:hypothetical protein [Aquimarina sp. U1-2]MBP2831202.1 hypothetical protein [Aquimarina sp. U1-2]